MGDGELLATTLAMLAQAVFAQGRLEEAEQLCRSAAGAGAPDDIVTQVIWRGVQAKILAHQGRVEEARGARPRRRRARRADRLALAPGDAMLDLAEVLAGDVRPLTSISGVVQTALSLYEQKGNVVGAARARSLLSHRVGGT